MVNYKSLLFTFCGILLSAPWASAYYEEKLSHPQVPAVEILPAVQEPSTTAGNIAERPLPQAAQGQVELESSSPPPPGVIGQAVQPSIPLGPSQPQLGMELEQAAVPGLYHAGKRRKPAKISSRGHQVPLSSAVQIVIPKGWHAEVKSLGKKRVSWNAKGRAWTTILGDMAKQSDAAITVDWDAGKIQCAPASLRKDKANNIPTPTVQGGIVKKAIIAQPGTGREVANRYRLPVDDFCRWNHFGPSTPLAAGYEVYLTAPPPGTIVVANMPNWDETGSAAVGIDRDKETADQVPQTSNPIRTAQPASLPNRRQTTAELTLENPEPGTPVTHKPLTITIPTEPTSKTATSIPDTSPTVGDVSSAPSREALTPVAATAIEAVPVWEIHKGEMLHNLMEGWAAIAGYSLIWNAQNDYEMRSSANFSGVFVDAVKNFFAALQANGLALRVTIYQGNKVMEVSEH